MKRAPTKCMEHHANEHYEGSILDMYRDLAKHNPAVMDLTAGTNVVFRTGRDHSITTIEDSTLTLQF